LCQYAIGSTFKEKKVGERERRKRPVTTASVARVPLKLQIVQLHKQVAELQREVRRWRRKALFDGLTGVFRREVILERLKELLESGSGEGTVLMILDLDTFKYVNDAYGHVAGDYVLQQAGKIISESIRRHDLVGRGTGGDEFFVLMFRAGLDDALRVGERIVSAMRSERFTPSMGASDRRGSFHVGISYGIAMFDPECQTVEEWYARADENMYTRKSAKRFNQE
jgi:two-component system, cell cycle response regulator